MASRVVRSVVVIAIAEASGLVAPWRGPRTLDAHVTLAAPFVDPELITDRVIEQLAAVLDPEPSFDVTFRSVGWFGHRVVFLAPAEPEPFERLAQRLRRAFLTDPTGVAASPYTPHLTVAKHRAVAELARAAVTAAAALPLRARAREVDLLVRDAPSDSWRHCSRVALGGWVTG